MNKEDIMQEVKDKVVEEPKTPIDPVAPVQTNNKRIIWFLISIIVLLGVSLTYLFLGNNKEVVKNNPAENKAISVETSESEGIKEDPTKDWKTYKNEIAGFSISYPNSWEQITINAMTEIKDESGKRIGVQGMIKLKGEDTEIVLGFGGGFGGATCSYKGGVLENFKVGNQTTYLCASIPSDPRDTNTKSEYKYSWINGCADCGGLIANNGDDYFVSISSNKNNLPETVRQILSTFKFDGNEGDLNKKSTNRVIDDDAVDIFEIGPLSKEWDSVEYCGIKHKRHEMMKSTYHQELSDNNTCFFGYDIADLVGLTIPAELVTAVFKGYNGGSRREYYFSRMVDENLDRRYSGSEPFELNGKSWIKLNWIDINPDNDYFSPKVVYLSAKGDTLVAVEGSGQYGYRSFDDNVKKFLASFDF